MKFTAKSIGLFALSLITSGSITLAGAHLLGWTGKTVIVETALPGSSFGSYTALSNAAATPTNFVNAAEQSVDAVVHVKIKGERVQNYYNPFNDLFFGRPSTPQRQEVKGSGSGVILSKDGYIVTNNHVIKEANEISVTTSNNDEYDAVLIGTDPTTDIALLKIEAQDLPKISVGNSNDVRLGQWVLAVGNPFNLTSTVTAGIISAKGRDINIIDEQSAIESFLQTDAAVNPGNSGGALVNTAGELVGINTAISSRSGSFEGYSFAVPANLVMKVVGDLKEFGRVQRAFIGINYNELNARLSEQLDLAINSGVYVANVVQGGAAALAGIEEGDVIINIDGKIVRTGADLTEAVGSKRPGEEVSVVINRNGENQPFTLILKNRLGTTEMLTREEEILRSYGAKLNELNTSEKRSLGLRYGIRVEEVLGGRFEKAGIPEGFIIVKLNNVYIESIAEFEKLIQQFNPGDGALIQGFELNGQANYYAFEW